VALRWNFPRMIHCRAPSDVLRLSFFFTRLFSTLNALALEDDSRALVYGQAHVSHDRFLLTFLQALIMTKQVHERHPGNSPLTILPQALPYTSPLPFLASFVMDAVVAPVMLWIVLSAFFR